MGEHLKTEKKKKTEQGREKKNQRKKNRGKNREEKAGNDQREILQKGGCFWGETEKRKGRQQRSGEAHNVTEEEIKK